MQQPSSGKRDFRALMIHQLHILTRHSEREAEAAFQARLGLSLLECRIIGLVGSAGSMSFKGLSAQARFEKSHASRLVAGLVRAGLIEGSVDPADHRATILRLTDKGQQHYGVIYEVVDERNRRWLAVLSEDEREGLVKGLASLTRWADGPADAPTAPKAPVKATMLDDPARGLDEILGELLGPRARAKSARTPKP